MRYFNIVVLLFLVSVKIFADVPPGQVLKTFKQKFPSAVNLKWHNDRGVYWEAKFTLTEKKVSASFTPDGHWIKSSMEISSAELSEEVRSSVKKDFPGCEIIYIEMREELGLGTFYTIKVLCGKDECGKIYDSNGYGPPII
jgi:hypothetical protein